MIQTESSRLLTLLVLLSLASLNLASPLGYNQQQHEALMRAYQDANRFNQQQVQPEESARNEIEDDLTAADLDLDGAAATNENENESPASDEDRDDLEDNEGQDSNIENAKIDMNSRDMDTAAGHHHHHHHYPHGWLKMGAETGKKGSFKWHDKHPVGGKGK